MAKTTTYIAMDIHVLLDDNPVEHDVFWDAFVDFLESNKWCFVGTTELITEAIWNSH
jgi:hypothetical protein